MAPNSVIDTSEAAPLCGRLGAFPLMPDMDVVGADPNWPFLEVRNASLSIAGGMAETTLPADVWRVTSVYNATDKIPLTPIPGRADFRHWFPAPADGLGIPLFYRLRGNVLEVYPWPAVTTEIDVDVAQPPAALTAGADEPIFPEQFHQLLVLGALARAYEDDGAPNQATPYQGRYERLLQSMKQDLLSVRTEGLMRQRPWPMTPGRPTEASWSSCSSSSSSSS